MTNNKDQADMVKEAEVKRTKKPGIKPGEVTKKNYSFYQFPCQVERALGYVYSKYSSNSPIEGKCIDITAQIKKAKEEVGNEVIFIISKYLTSKKGNFDATDLTLVKVFNEIKSYLRNEN